MGWNQSVDRDDRKSAVESALEVFVVIMGNIAVGIYIAIAGSTAIGAVGRSLRPTQKKSETLVSLLVAIGPILVSEPDQYLGTLGSTSLDQAVMPPRRFFIGPE